MSNSNIKNDFQTFLIKQGYKTLTPSGNKSTVYDYIKRIDFVCEIEKYNWKNLGDNIDQILYDYGPSGIKANLGAKSHNAVISALKQYKIFTEDKNSTKSTYITNKNYISNENLNLELKQEVLNAIKRSRLEIKGFNPIGFERILAEEKYNIVSVAQRVVRKNSITSGMEKLLFAKPCRLDLSLEAIIIQDKYFPLFQGEKFEIIRNAAYCLMQYGFIAKDRYKEIKNYNEQKLNHINQNPKETIQKTHTENLITSNESFIVDINKQDIKETEKQALIKIRIGHSKLKEIVLRNKTKCDICGLSHPKLLIASHIKPWSQSGDKEKLDYHNILLLCPIHDALFDKGLISFNDNGRILISNELNNQNRILANIDDSSCINVTSEKQKEYLQWHRENIFIK